jgi:hypothetical protein
MGMEESHADIRESTESAFALSLILLLQVRFLLFESFRFMNPR